MKKIIKKISLFICWYLISIIITLGCLYTYLSENPALLLRLSFIFSIIFYSLNNAYHELKEEIINIKNQLDNKNL